VPPRAESCCRTHRGRPRISGRAAAVGRVADAGSQSAGREQLGGRACFGQRGLKGFLDVREALAGALGGLPRWRRRHQVDVGRLPSPVHVEAIAAELNLAEEWIGSFNRESQTPPVLEFRESAVRLGLPRKYQGKLLSTARGRNHLGRAFGIRRQRRLAVGGPVWPEWAGRAVRSRSIPADGSN
jgi:hypothetical protein